MVFSPPSAYTPLLRRFGNEKARELAETEALYNQVKASHQRFAETQLTIGQRVYDRFLSTLPDDIGTLLTQEMLELIENERYMWELPAPDFGRMDMREFVEYRNLLHQKQYFHANEAAILELLHQGLVRLLYSIGRELPQTEDPSPFTIPLMYALPNPAAMIEATYATLTSAEYYDRGLFRNFGQRLFENICRVSGRDPTDGQSKKALVFPTDSPLPLDEMVDGYLGGTPFHRIFNHPLPLRLTHEDRFNHMHVLGGSGAGKTSLIENLILSDLRSDDPPTIVVIDPHSDLVRKLVRADIGIEDRIIYIDPRDTQHPVALNPFAVNRERLANYDEVTREQVTAGVIQTLGFFWSGLTNLNLTGKQDVFAKYCIRLLLTLPEIEGRNATILDMLKLMEPVRDAKGIDGVPEPYRATALALPPIQREFFQTDFSSKTFEGTKEQIRYRIQAIVENPTMARLFTATETKVDLFTELNRGSVILVDTAKDFLKDSSPVFGKLMISLVLQAVLERAAIPENRRKATFLMVDEAGSFFSSNIDDLLTEARKYKCGLLLAHQYLDQATSSLRASLAANTGSKLVSGLSAADARSMASEMRTTPDFILDQPRLRFAAHIRNVTPNAVSIPVVPGIFDRIGRLSDRDYEAFLAKNRKRVSLSPSERIGTRMDEDSRPSVSPRGSEDTSAKWE